MSVAHSLLHQSFDIINGNNISYWITWTVNKCVINHLVVFPSKEWPHFFCSKHGLPSPRQMIHLLFVSLPTTWSPFQLLPRTMATPFEVQPWSSTSWKSTWNKFSNDFLYYQRIDLISILPNIAWRIRLERIRSITVLLI